MFFSLKSSREDEVGKMSVNFIFDRYSTILWTASWGNPQSHKLFPCLSFRLWAGAVSCYTDRADIEEQRQWEISTSKPLFCRRQLVDGEQFSGHSYALFVRILGLDLHLATRVMTSDSLIMHQPLSQGSYNPVYECIEQLSETTVGIPLSTMLLVVYLRHLLWLIIGVWKSSAPQLH